FIRINDGGTSRNDCLTASITMMKKKITMIRFLDSSTEPENDGRQSQSPWLRTVRAVDFLSIILKHTGTEVDFLA
ncbi:MAG: hypothetical protein JSV53_10180, partial [candidate division WOR-3 bacterium]